MSTRRIRSTVLRSLSALALVSTLGATQAEASPVLLAGSGTEKVHSTDMTFLQKDGVTVLSVLPDYQGPLSPFAVIVAVPGDVTKDRISTLKREFNDRVSKISAPKFAEFFEMDPCDEAKVEQDWERDMTAKANTGFLGTVKTDPTKKVAKEMLLDVEAKTKSGEYKETFLGDAEALKKWLGDKEYELPSGGAESLEKYESEGYKFLALDVDVNRMELVGSDRALLSPIRFWSESELKKLPTRFGLPSAAKNQELQLFTMVPGQRMQVTNYDTKAIPTNLSIPNEYEQSADKKFNLKEKIGEFYAALHDAFAAKNPKTFLLEYAWSTADCGKPCATEPLLPHEILSLGADVFESRLPEDVRRPEAPEASEEEKNKLEAQLSGKKTPKEKKDFKEQWEKDRAELAARKGLIERNEYVLTRLHYRYTAAEMPKDVELGGGAPISGGVALPAGEFGDADQSVAGAKENTFQARYNGNFQNIKVVKCENPKPHRWGKPPRSYRGLRKIWVAEDLGRRNRKRIDLTKAVLSPNAELALPGRVKPEAAAPVAAVDAEEKKDEGGCAVANPGQTGGRGAALLMSLGLGWALTRRRKSAS